MIEQTNLSNHFLIAMPTLADPNFFHTVTYICEHNQEGAMGIVINRTHAFTMRELFSQMDIEYRNPALAEVPIYQGGPVHPESGFVLHQPVGEWEASLNTGEDIGLTASQDIIRAIANDTGPENFIMALGYAGWGAGQLEQEMLDNAWLAGPASSEILFHTPMEQKWSAAAALLGVDLSLLSTETGHA